MFIREQVQRDPSWTNRSTSARLPLAVTTTSWRAAAGTPAGTLHDPPLLGAGDDVVPQIPSDVAV
jgi:hypothetical protein